MKAQPIIGGLLVVMGFLILYFLRDLLFKVVVVVLGVIGLLIGFAFIVGGLALVFWRRRTWYRVETATRT